MRAAQQTGGGSGRILLWGSSYCWEWQLSLYFCLGSWTAPGNGEEAVSEMFTWPLLQWFISTGRKIYVQALLACKHTYLHYIFGEKRDGNRVGLRPAPDPLWDWLHPGLHLLSSPHMSTLGGGSWWHSEFHGATVSSNSIVIHLKRSR